MADLTEEQTETKFERLLRIVGRYKSELLIFAVGFLMGAVLFG